jgi:GntR family transcriptional repressor for pyruvate dehydrogenase complex
MTVSAEKTASEEERSELLDPLREQCLTPVGVRPAWEVVAQRLDSAIRLGAFATGELLPPERTLAERLQVSRGIVRDALRALVYNQLVRAERGPGGGHRVLRPSTTAEWLRPGASSQLDGLIDWREILEIEGAQRAAKARTNDELLRMEKALAEMKRASDAESFMRWDSVFHLMLAQASRVRELMSQVTDVCQRLSFPAEAPGFAAARDDAVAQHRAILEAVQQRKGKEAAEAMRAHLEATRKTYRELHRQVLRDAVASVA